MSCVAVVVAVVFVVDDVTVGVPECFEWIPKARDDDDVLLLLPVEAYDDAESNSHMVEANCWVSKSEKTKWKMMMTMMTAMSIG